MSRKPVYLFYGPEDFSIEEEIESLRSKIIAPGFETLNLEVMDGSQVEISQIINSIQTQPMLGGEKLIIIKGTEVFSKDKEVGPLMASIKNIKEGVTLIFTAGEVDRRKKLFKTIEKLGVAKEFRAFADWEQQKVITWIVKRVEKEGKKIGDQAASLLMEISGSNLRRLASEVGKLVTYIGEQEAIEESHVVALASAGQIHVFSLLSALRNKDLRAALVALIRLLKNKENPVRLLQLLVTQYRMLLQVKSLQGEGLEAYKIAQKLKASPYFVRKCLEGTSNFSLTELSKDMELLQATDVRLKTTGESPGLVLELLLTDLCLGSEAFAS